MEIYKLKINEFSTKMPSRFVIEKIFNKNKIKTDISNSGKSILFHDQNILFNDQINMFNVARNIITLSPDITMRYENNTIFIDQLTSYKLIIEHDIILDCFNDLDQDDKSYLFNFYKECSIYYSEENNIIKIHAQKCTLEFDKINNILSHITYGSQKESYIEMYDNNRYGISQIKGYKKYLKT